MQIEKRITIILRDLLSGSSVRLSRNVFMEALPSAKFEASNKLYSLPEIEKIHFRKFDCFSVFIVTSSGVFDTGLIFAFYRLITFWTLYL